MMMRLEDKEKLLARLEVINHPKRYGLTQELADQALIDFCAASPDPVGARWLIVECLDPMTDEEIVDRALSMPTKDMESVPASVVPLSHPARDEIDRGGEGLFSDG